MWFCFISFSSQNLLFALKNNIWILFYCIVQFIVFLFLLWIKKNILSHVGENSYLLNMKTLNMFNIVTSGFLLNSSLHTVFCFTISNHHYIAWIIYHRFIFVNHINSLYIRDYVPYKETNVFSSGYCLGMNQNIKFICDIVILLKMWLTCSLVLNFTSAIKKKEILKKMHMYHAKLYVFDLC